VDTLVGTSLGGYTLTRLLGSGGMGAVYLAIDPKIGQQVAIKVIRTDPADYPDSASTIRAAERFKQEARAIASLDHLHILPLYRYGEEQTDHGQQAYMVMQYRPEGSLWDWIRQRASRTTSEVYPPSHIQDSNQPFGLEGTWPLSVEEAGEYLQQAASALQYAHDRGIIHRDIKPANFLLRFEEGKSVHLLLSDFGLAKFFSSNSATSHVFGTPIYMAPEQFNGEAGPGSDQYALAIMIYCFLTTHPPFEGDPMRLMHQHLFIEPAPPRRFNPVLPEGVEKAVLQALAKKPADRHASIAAFANAFTQGIYQVPTRQKPRSLQGIAPQVHAQDSKEILQGSFSPQPLQTGGNPDQVAAHSPFILQAKTPLQASPEAPTVAQNTPTIQPQELPVQRTGNRQPSPETPIAVSQVNAASAPTVLPMAPQPYVYSGQAEVLQRSISSTLPARDAVSPRSWPPAAPSLSSPASFLPATPLQPAQVTQPVPPPAPKQQRMSRRSALGWIIGGVAAVGIGSGAGIYFYLRDRTPDGAMYVLRGHSGTVTSISWSPRALQLVSGSRDGTARIWSASHENTTVTYRGHSAPVLAVAWSPDGALLASGGEDQTVQLWNTAGTSLHNFADWGASISSLAWRNDSKALFVGTLGAGAHELLLSSGERPGRSAGINVHAIALSPDGNYLAVGAASGQIIILNLGTLKYTFYHHHTGPILALAWSQDGTMLASGSADTTALVGDPISGTILHTLPHGGAVNGVAWEPGNTARLATASADSKMRVWDVNSGDNRVYSGHWGAVTSVAWSFNGLATGSTDTDIIVWNV
jgi:serine/threonine protein kinase/WD40 repeat protein